MSGKVEINNNSNEITRIAEEKCEFENFLEEDKLYMENLANFNKCEETIEQLGKQIENLNALCEELKIKYDEKYENLKNLESVRDEIKVKLTSLGEVNIGKMLQNSIEELEKMKDELTSKFTNDREIIEKRIAEASKKIEKNKAILVQKYGDVLGKYEDVVYSEEAKDLAIDNKEKQSREVGYAKDEFNKANLERTKMFERKNNAMANLENIGKEEPCLRNFIKENYEERRAKNKKLREEENEKIKLLEKEIKIMNESQNSLMRVIERPEDRNVEIDDFDYKKVSIEEKVKEYRLLQDKNREEQNKINNFYNDIKNENLGTNTTIDSFLENINPYGQGKEFADYYFVYERLTESIKVMDALLSEIETSLKHIEDDIENIKYKALGQGKDIYIEMKKISDNANVKMPGKLRKTSLLEIELPKELDAFAKNRIDEYIDECIANLREECKKIESSEEKRKLIDKKVRGWLSDRQLLNKVINSETIEVKLYKIDISEKNSGLRKWKDVIVENSGGEKFISCLILVIALIQYSRTKIFERAGSEKTLETTKIFIIDNPFGKMSSTHLLKGLTDILAKFNVQAICLSDLSQSSITNQFNVIYQMSLKTGKYTEKFYLTTDDVRVNGDVSKNYLLEQVWVRKEEQMSMF